jgi:hypothetical protein
MTFKRFFPIVFFLCFSIITFAQKFNGGYLIGFTTSQINGDGIGGFYKYGPTAGFFVNRDFSNKIDGIFEIRYTGKGSGDGIGNFKINLGYVELPFLLRYNTSYKLGLKIGIAPAVKVFERTIDAYQYKAHSNDFSIVELPLHMGLDYPLTKKLNFDLRYSYSSISAGQRRRYTNMCLYFTLHRNFN